MELERLGEHVRLGQLGWLTRGVKWGQCISIYGSPMEYGYYTHPSSIHHHICLCSIHWGQYCLNQGFMRSMYNVFSYMDCFEQDGKGVINPIRMGPSSLRIAGLENLPSPGRLSSWRICWRSRWRMSAVRRRDLKAHNDVQTRDCLFTVGWLINRSRGYPQVYVQPTRKWYQNPSTIPKYGQIRTLFGSDASRRKKVLNLEGRPESLLANQSSLWNCWCGVHS